MKSMLPTNLNWRKSECISCKIESQCTTNFFCVRGFNDQNDNLRVSLEEMCKKYDELRGICQREEISSKSLTESHRDLSTRLLKAVRLLIDEKVARQQEKCRLEAATEEINKLKSEKVIIAVNVRAILSLQFFIKGRFGWKNRFSHNRPQHFAKTIRQFKGRTNGTRKRLRGITRKRK